MRVVKMHGEGNDFLLLNNFKEKLSVEELPELAKTLCHRRYSLGADGLILADESDDGSDFRMRFYNSDGSIGEMCGNGARCLARFAYEEGIAGHSMRFQTLAGHVKAWRLEESLYKIALPLPSLIEEMTLQYNQKDYCGVYVELGDPGVPHFCLEFEPLDTLEENELRELGRALRNHPMFNKGANVNFYKKLSDTQYLEKTFERGVEDFTLACGTGSGSVAVALQKVNPKIRDERLHLAVPGGNLYVESEWIGEEVKNIYLIGGAVKVFETIL